MKATLLSLGVGIEYEGVGFEPIKSLMLNVGYERFLEIRADVGELQPLRQLRRELAFDAIGRFAPRSKHK